MPCRGCGVVRCVARCRVCAMPCLRDAVFARCRVCAMPCCGACAALQRVAARRCRCDGLLCIARAACCASRAALARMGATLPIPKPRVSAEQISGFHAFMTSHCGRCGACGESKRCVAAIGSGMMRWASATAQAAGSAWGVAQHMFPHGHHLLERS